MRRNWTSEQADGLTFTDRGSKAVIINNLAEQFLDVEMTSTYTSLRAKLVRSDRSRENLRQACLDHM